MVGSWWLENDNCPLQEMPFSWTWLNNSKTDPVHYGHTNSECLLKWCHSTPHHSSLVVSRKVWRASGYVGTRTFWNMVIPLSCKSRTSWKPRILVCARQRFKVAVLTVLLHTIQELLSSTCNGPGKTNMHPIGIPISSFLNNILLLRDEILPPFHRQFICGQNKPQIHHGYPSWI